MRALILVLVVLAAAGCGGHSAAASQPSVAQQKACALAVYRLDVRVWVLGEPVDANLLGPARVACPWVGVARLRAATQGGMADYRRRVRGLFGG